MPRPRLADTRVRRKVAAAMNDAGGRPVVDWRLVDDLQELAADFQAEGANDTAAAVRMAVLVAFHEAGGSRPVR